MSEDKINSSVSRSDLPREWESADDDTRPLSFEDRLVLARASRTHAESTRQSIANEILSATREICNKLITEGETTLAKAKTLEAKADQRHLEALQELEQAESTREEAVLYAARVVAEANEEAAEIKLKAQTEQEEAEAYAATVKEEAKQQAEKLEAEAATVLEEADAYAVSVRQETEEKTSEAETASAQILQEAEERAAELLAEAKERAEAMEQQAAKVLEDAEAFAENLRTETQEKSEEMLRVAREAAAQETEQILRDAQEEAGRALEEVESLRGAAQQELEAQQIYAETARATVESLEVLAQIRSKLAEYSVYCDGESSQECEGLEQSASSGDVDAAEQSPSAGNLSDDQLKAWLD